MIRRAALSLVVAFSALPLTAEAYDGYQPPNSLLWPLHQGNTNTPRRGIGNNFGEYQEYDTLVYAHTGIDIRGAEDDRVKVAATSKIWVAVNYTADVCTLDSDCRIYMRDDRYIYYYAHLKLVDGADDEITAATREAIEEASQWDAMDGTYALPTGPDLPAGTVLSRIGPFSGATFWPHLHFSIVDTETNYDAINPLTALDRFDTDIEVIDDEPPFIESVELFTEGTANEVGNDWCDPVSGSVDIAATMYDTVMNDPDPSYDGYALGIQGVFDARYSVRSHASGADVASGTWYTFDRAPLACAGPNRGDACPTDITESGFSAYSFLQPLGTGMLVMSEPYTPQLFAVGPSEGFYDGERYVHLLTNTWGEPGTWDTADVSDGWYQVTVTAKDVEQNEYAFARFVAVENDGNFVAPADAYMKDNPDDVGALPSTAGGRPFWTSPDIFVLPAGSGKPSDSATAPDTLLVAGVYYEVWVRVRNGYCAPVTDIGVQVYSANPAMFQDTDDWVYLTEEGEFEQSIDLDPGEIDYFGPFPWTPTVAEAQSNAGHRCLRAKIHSTDDPAGTDGVPNDNNFTQKNLEFGETSFDFGNPGLATASVGTKLRCNGFPFWKQGATMELRVAYNTLLWTAWQNVPGTVVTLSGATIVVRFLRCNVTLPSVQLPAGTHLHASFKTTLPAKTVGSWVIDLHGYYNGALSGGMSFRAKAP